MTEYIDKYKIKITAKDPLLQQRQGQKPRLD